MVMDFQVDCMDVCVDVWVVVCGVVYCINSIHIYEMIYIFGYIYPNPDPNPNYLSPTIYIYIALHYAVYSNSPDICSKLVDEGANRNVRDINKKKPMHLAIFKDYGLCCAVLQDLKSKLAMATGDNLNI